MSGVQLPGNGWNLSASGLSKINDQGKINDRNTLLKIALNTDLKEIGCTALSQQLAKNCISDLVLQIQKIRNISAPKANEDSQAAPRMLKLVITDGENYAQAIEVSQISSLSREKTPPGTKIHIKNAKVVNGFIVLSNENCTILGGKVPHLYEKWELAKSIQYHSRKGATTESAPAWVNFGKKLDTSSEKNFKSLETKTKEANEASEFELQRQKALEVAATGAVKKTFGGGVQKSIQNSLNNKKNDGTTNDRFKNNRSRKELRKNDTDEGDRPEKPSEKVSLFDFLQNKLPIKNETSFEKPRYEKTSYEKPHFDKPHFQKDYQKSSEKSGFQKEPFGKPYNSKNNDRNGQNFKNSRAPTNFNKLPITANSNTNNYDNYPKKPDFKQENPKRYENSREKTNFDNQRNDFRHSQKTDFHQQKTDFYQQKTDFTNKPIDFNAIQNDFNNRPIDFNKKPTDFNKKLPEFRTKSTDNVDFLSNNVQKMNLNSNNSQFASRSFKQHLNLSGPNIPPKNDFTQSNGDYNNWKIGDECLALYWEDKKHYSAVISDITDKTFVVQFRGYGNVEEILKNDCLPIQNTKKNDNNQHQYYRNKRNPSQFQQ